MFTRHDALLQIPALVVGADRGKAGCPDDDALPVVDRKGPHVVGEVPGLALEPPQVEVVLHVPQPAADVPALQEGEAGVVLAGDGHRGRAGGRGVDGGRVVVLEEGRRETRQKGWKICRGKTNAIRVFISVSYFIYHILHFRLIFFHNKLRIMVNGHEVLDNTKQSNYFILVHESN